MNRFEEIRDAVLSFKADFEGYEANPNAATGMRVIKNMELLGILAQEIRIEVQRAQDVRVDIQEKKQS